MSDLDQPMHSMRPTERFQDRGEAYVKARPSYPAAAIDAVLEGLGPLNALSAADVGAGTGISSHLLADRNVEVFAIEPNEGMRAQAAPHARITWLSGTSEQTGLDDAWVGLVMCAQSFHWFQAERSLREFHRILKDGGRLAVLWNDRDNRDSLTCRYTQIVIEASNGHPAATRMVSEAPLLASRLFEDVHRLDFEMAHSLTRDGLIARAKSASYVPNEGPELERVVTELGKAFDAHADADGRVHMRYITRVYLARRVDGAMVG